MTTYMTNGTCARQIIFNINERGEIEDVKFIGGCSGNLQGIAKLVNHRPIDEVIELLSGIKCRNNTSCPDQLAKALIKYKNESK